MLLRTASRAEWKWSSQNPKMQKASIISRGFQWIGIRFLTRHSRTSWNTKVWALQLLKRAPRVLPTWQSMSGPELSVDGWEGDRPLVDMHLETRILFSLGWLSGGLESDCGEESVEIVPDSLIEAVQLTAFVGGEVTIVGKGLEETGGERGVDTLE